jgi:large subunit ribosomal protein L30e
MIDIDKAIATTVKTGKVQFGAGNAVKSAKLGRAKLILVASNCPKNTLDDIMYYAKLSDVPVAIYKGSSIDLGVTCGKSFMVSALTVREPGDSEILELGEKAKEAAREQSETEALEETDA